MLRIYASTPDSEDLEEETPGGVTNRYLKKALLYFSASLICTVGAVLLTIWGLFLASVLVLYAATFFLLRGFKLKAQNRRIRQEYEWWKNAKEGIEQDPLYPCCVLFGKTLLEHEEEHCTRYRYPKPRVITKEELVRINREWSEIISHMDDPEKGEEE